MTSLSPMLATIGTDVPTGPDWVFEPKFDGIRILAFVSSARARGKAAAVQLVSRNGLDKTKQFPEVAAALQLLYARVKRPFVLDGEVVAMKGDKPLRFQQLQGRVHVTNGSNIETQSSGAPAALMVFDLLMDGKTSLVAEAWRVRRRHLVALLQPPGSTGALRLSDVGEDGKAMLREARRRDWEGIIAKRADAPYDAGHRSRAWIKLKIERRQEFVVGGWTEPRRSREHIGAILLGYYDSDGKLIYSGHTGTGFTRKTLLELHTRLAKLERKSSPFSTRPKTNEAAHWTRPAVIVEIKFSEWTDDGRLRHPVFLGVRDDKAPRDVVHEPESMVTPPPSGRARAPSRPAARAAASVKTAPRRTARTVAVTAPRVGVARSNVAEDSRRIAAQLDSIEAHGGAGTIEWSSGSLAVSKLDKVFFPKTKHTKGDVMRYYAQVAPLLLPTMTDRPLVMKRFPNGVPGKAFYQQRAPSDAPAGVRIEPVSDEGLLTQNRLIGGDLGTLLYLAQLAAVSIDPWHSRVGSIKFADYAIIDLDPGEGASFQHVVEVAHAVKNVLDRLRLHAVAKTSGASGIHIVLPLGPGVPNDGARMIAELIATMTVEMIPRTATIERFVKQRPRGSVYVDFLQNIRGKTVAGVYSVRARPSPTVSTPLHWDEVDERLDPTSYTIDTLPDRIAQTGDLWAKGMKVPNSLEGIIGNG
jgi:bifunctional non-homologous end joining protein LigD